MGKRKVGIIGGGAAGFFSAINIAENCPDAEVVILEKTSKILTKVKVSGGGRCNVTHGCFDPKELVDYYPRGEKELLGPFHHFMTGDTIEWFANHGVELKMEEDGRMFPVSNSSQTIIDCFLKASQKLNIEIHQNVSVDSIKHQGSGFILSNKKGFTVECDYVVAALGGNSKLKHYDLFTDLGHKIVPPIPSLFTFNLPKHASNQLMGLAVPATVKICNTKYEAYGPLLITHWGMSGPAILKLSAMAARYLHECSYQFNFEVSWLENSESFIEENRKHNGKQLLKNTKISGIPNRFLMYLLKRSEVDLGKKWADLSKSEMSALKEVLEFDVYSANGKTTFKEEFVTCGGIDLKEVDMKNFESKLIPNLFLCGELLNIDAITGGFNFQAAWTGGYIVAQEIAKRLGN